jgi:hypothetical protein
LPSLPGEFTPGKVGEWRFDKRWWGGRPVSRGLDPPPPGCKNELVRRLIEMFNEATDAIPCWDAYAKSAPVRKVGLCATAVRCGAVHNRGSVCAVGCVRACVVGMR